MNLKLLFVGVLAVALLGLYIYSMSLAVGEASRCAKLDADYKKDEKVVDCTTAEKNLENGIGTIFSAVGGLVAAFALGFLAVTESNIPNQGLESVIAPDKNSISEMITKAIPLIFVLTWLLCGIVAVIYGLIKYWGIVPPLTEMAKAWIGTAIAGIGAFWGIRPK